MSREISPRLIELAREIESAAMDEGLRMARITFESPDYSESGYQSIRAFAIFEDNRTAIWREGKE